MIDDARLASATASAVLGIDTLCGGDVMSPSGTRRFIADSWFSGDPLPEAYTHPTAQALRAAWPRRNPTPAASRPTCARSTCLAPSARSAPRRGSSPACVAPTSRPRSRAASDVGPRPGAARQRSAGGVRAVRRGEHRSPAITRSRSCRPTAGRPGDFPRLESHVQYSAKPARCHPITVSGFTMTTASAHLDHSRRNTTQNALSAGPISGRRFCRTVESC